MRFETFVFSALHDIINGLQIIRNVAFQINEGQDGIKLIQKQVDMITTQANNIRLFNDKKLDLQITEIALNEFLEKCIQGCDEFCKLNISLVTDAQTNLPKQKKVKYNSFYLEQIFRNLSTNSNKAGASKVVVMFRLKKDSLLVTIKDNGKEYDNLEYSPYHGNGKLIIDKAMSQLNGHTSIVKHNNNHITELVFKTLSV